MDFQQIRKYVKGVLTNSFLNKTTLDKLSTSDEGNLLFDGKELKNIGNIEASITELWSGQQSVSAEITLLDDYANYDIIISMVEPLEDYPTQQKFDFMLKGAESLTGGMTENGSYIASYRLNNWNSTSVYFRRDNSSGGWNLTLRKIWGIKFISQQHEYSTEEKVVGTWVNGKPLYEKTFKTTVNVTGSAEYFSNIIVEDAEEYFIENAFCTENENGTGAIQMIGSVNFNGNYDYNITSFNLNTGRWWIIRGSGTSPYTTIIVRYTKTTD